MKIIVTGGAGFIGSALVRKLVLTTEHKVINIDSLTYAGNKESLSEIEGKPNYHFQRSDITDRDEINRIFRSQNPDAIIHLAAESHVDRSISSPADVIQTNIVGTFNLLEASRSYLDVLSDKAKKSAFRFHHVSTDEVFGDLDSEMSAFTEKSSYDPSSPYSASKASSDHLVRAWHRTFGLPVVITNCSNNYGPYQYPEKLIPLTIMNALNLKPIPIYGNGKQIRDWLYVNDHVDALYAVLLGGINGNTYNIGGNNEIRNIDVVKIICEILGELTDVSTEEYLSLITYVEDRPGHDKRYSVDSTKIQNELGWAPKENFVSGIRKTVIWYLRNQEWTDSVIHQRIVNTEMQKTS